MIKRLTAIILLLALISANLSGLFIYAQFKANQGYIATSLCENRDKPQLHCEGKCYLMKKLKDAEEKEKQQEQSSQKKGYDVSILTSPLTVAFSKVKVKKQKPALLSFVLPEICSEIPHPPPSLRFS